MTIHKENGIRYKLDPQKIMFSSGNMSERIRMAHIEAQNEIVVDLFAGIGYFTLPLAVYGKPQKIVACELNAISHRFLCDNIVLNHVTERVQPLLGDNRDIAPRNVAHRVIMGYIGNTDRFLPVACECLKNTRGIIHYHDIFPNTDVAEKPMRHIKEIVGNYGRCAQLLRCILVKSYAPGISHFVFDVKVGE